MKILLSLLFVAGVVGAGLYFSSAGSMRASPDADMLELGAYAYQEQRYEDAFNWYKYAADQGLRKGQFQLSQLYQLGKGVEKDEAMAVHWMEMAAKQGFAKAEYEYAKMIEFGRGIAKGDSGKVAMWYKKAAKQHYPEAMLKLSKLYHHGLGLPQDDNKALTWVMRAEEKNVANATTFRQQVTKAVMGKAKAGHAKSQYMLANLYQKGLGVGQSKSRALQWYKKAAKQKHPEAQYALAKGLVEAGEENFNRALVWFERAAKQGHAQAGSASVAILARQKVTGNRAKLAWRWMYHGMKQQDPKAEYNLASAFQSGLFGLGNVEMDIGVWLEFAAKANIMQAQNDYAVYLVLHQQDMKATLQWFTKAAATDAKAQFNLGFIYARGDGVTPDDDSAVRWWNLAEKNGSTRAKMMLGLFYDLGRGVGRSEKKALEWYQEAANLGEMNALYNMAVLYYNGRGLDRDFEQAAKYFKVMANMGDLAAQNIYGSLFLSGQGVIFSPETAIQWFKRAATAGNAKAMFNLATQYRRGQGVDQDDEVSLSWYRKAADLGFAPAQNALGYMYAEGRGAYVDKAAAQLWFEKASESGLSIAAANLSALQSNTEFSLVGLQIDNILRAGMLNNKNVDVSQWLEVHAQPIW